MKSDDGKNIEKLARQLAEERERRLSAERDAKAKGELLAIVAHEVRTPLGAIHSIADLLARTNLDETQRGYVSTLHGSATSLLAVVNDVLDQAKRDADAFALNARAIDLHAFLTAFEAEAEIRATHKGLDFALDIAPTCPQWVDADPMRLRQVMQNYFSNALKFTSEGSIELKVKAEETQSGLALIRFEMHDSGTGFSPEVKAELFEPYVQAPASCDTPDGTGLGLYIVKKLARLMTGDCGCASMEGQGSVFWFTALMPLAKAKAENSRSAAETVLRSANAPESLQGHVLIVDDNDINQMILAALLDQFGVRCDSAASGEEAIAAVQRQYYDAVLMDVMMPVLDGLKTTRRIRALGPAQQAIPIIAISAKEIEPDDRAYFSAGMNGCLLKPISVEELFAELSKYLKAAAPVLDGTNC